MHYRPSGKNLHKNSYRKQVNSEKKMIFAVEKINCEICELLYFTTENECHLKSEEHKNLEVKQQSQIKWILIFMIEKFPEKNQHETSVS